MVGGKRNTNKAAQTCHKLINTHVTKSSRHSRFEQAPGPITARAVSEFCYSVCLPSKCEGPTLHNVSSASIQLHCTSGTSRHIYAPRFRHLTSSNVAEVKARRDIVHVIVGCWSPSGLAYWKREVTWRSNTRGGGNGSDRHRSASATIGCQSNFQWNPMALGSRVESTGIQHSSMEFSGHKIKPIKTSDQTQTPTNPVRV